jgi:hypothetical protein
MFAETSDFVITKPVAQCTHNNDCQHRIDGITLSLLTAGSSTADRQVNKFDFGRIIFFFAKIMILKLSCNKT